MIDSKQPGDLKPEQSWLKAEKMLDRRYQRKVPDPQERTQNDDCIANRLAAGG